MPTASALIRLPSLTRESGRAKGSAVGGGILSAESTLRLSGQEGQVVQAEYERLTAQGVVFTQKPLTWVRLPRRCSTTTAAI